MRPIATLLFAAALALTACTEARETAPYAEARERAGFAQPARVYRVAPAAAPMVTQARAEATAADVALFPRSSIVSSMVIRTGQARDRKSTRLNSSHSQISYAVFCLKKKNKERQQARTSRLV